MGWKGNNAAVKIQHISPSFHFCFIGRILHVLYKDKLIFSKDKVTKETFGSGWSVRISGTH